MKTFTRHPRPPKFQRSCLGQAIGLVLAGLFSLNVIEAEAEDNAIEAPARDVDPPSAAGVMASPSYLQLALQASEDAPRVFAARLLGAPAPINVTVADGIGIATAGAHDDATVNLAAARTVGVLAQGASSVGFNGGTVNSSALIAANAAGQTGLLASNGGQLSGNGVTVNLAPKASNGVVLTVSNMTGVSAKSAGQVSLRDSNVSMGGNVSGLNNQGLVASGSGSHIDFAGGSVSTLSKGSVAVVAQDGGSIRLSEGSVISTTGAPSPTTASHGLKATGAGSRIDASDVAVNVGAAGASAVRAEDGAHIQLKDSTLLSTSAASSTSSTAILHALGGASIEADRSQVSATGNYLGGVRADGAGSSVTVKNGSSLSIKGSGSAADYASGARAMNGGAVVLQDSTVSTQGTFSHGVSVEGSGSRADVSNSSINVDGARSHGIYVKDGASAAVNSSKISLDTVPGNAGPWGLGALVEGTGSSLRLDDSEVRTTQKTSYGARALAGANLEINNGLIDTQGNYSTGLTAASSTVVARNLTITTSGNDNAMGVVADTASTITLYGGSVTTTGNGSPISSNLTFPHALASRNPGAQLNAYGTSVRTTGTQAYGAAVDDGGSMLLDGLSVQTEGQYSVGLYAGIGKLKPSAVSLIARNVSVETHGDQAPGALVSRQYQADEAKLELFDSTVSTHGLRSHGLQAESGAQLSASNTSASTTGVSALGALANNTAHVDLDQVGVNTSGDLAHGAVAKNGGVLAASASVINASGQEAAALYAQGTDTLTGKATIDNSVLHNRDGATVGVAGVADISLIDSIVGGSGQWLNVDSAVASDGSTMPDMGTGQWQGVGSTLASAGNARIDVSGSVLNGSARTAAGSDSTVSLSDTSIWNLTGESNLGSLRNEASLIDFSAPVGGSFKNLTVNNYHGDNGTIALNTYLYTDNSPSDKLVVDGGTADGSSNLMIKNAGGPGALTQGNGIMVVDAVNGATTDTEAFRLLNRVKAGPYEYTLHRASQDDSNGEAWYLRSTKDADPVDPVKPVDPVNPVNPVNPVDPLDPVVNPVPDTPVRPQVPNYRAETSLYRALPSMLLHYSHAMVDTLHERVGEERRLATDPLPGEAVDTYGPSLGWGRLIYRKGEQDLGDGASADYRIHAFQVGADLYRNDDIDGSTDQAGLSLSIGRIAGSVEHNDGANAGDDLLRAYGVGGYWTHFGPEGWYLDGVLQFNQFDLKTSPNDLDGLKTRARGVTASLEAGYPFHAEKDKDLHVEPQAQVIVSKIKVDDTHDEASDVRFDDVDSLTGRIGVRIDKDWFREDDKGKIHRTNAWVRPSVWHEFKGKAKTEFSSADGYIPFGTDMSGTWGEMNMGVDYQVNERTTVTGSLGYQKAFGEDSRSYEGMIGIKVKF
ncbi:autotransporter outer membrane beta-barrel domain-containing protein [Pseudomonas sp. GD03860]|uniref:autotransporter outer membrane beta-barrel domain-containing protein n=1 Tax=Pseudomonas TaxID=286 RepID=UPI002363BBD8|nr:MULTISPECIES: autotransporter outer membrane beta-barrel domain-containing protein [Pseudomonas]MDD2056917.1 autotransporter outer membrane beta-barrel domain-containing protein [Pseudomonas putida]MDH0637883.1 autotransporter outer membrane beta-barrel domain-containing protein [Pseudomonas sp. GD03860]